jgi:hypothetical protein
MGTLYLMLSQSGGARTDAGFSLRMEADRAKIYREKNSFYKTFKNHLYSLLRKKGDSFIGELSAGARARANAQDRILF